jgi:hypothetical protein
MLFTGTKDFGTGWRCCATPVARDFSSKTAAGITRSKTACSDSIGTCSKCVSLFRIAAAPEAESTLAISKAYGENLLYLSAPTQRPPKAMWHGVNATEPTARRESGLRAERAYF